MILENNKNSFCISDIKKIKKDIAQPVFFYMW